MDKELVIEVGTAEEVDEVSQDVGKRKVVQVETVGDSTEFPIEEG